MSQPAVTVVIPVWNGRDYLTRLLEKLRSQSYPVAEVIAVDNGSNDGAPGIAKQNGARVLKMGSNLGFSRAVNAGIEASRTELIAVMNSDVEPEPDWLMRLVNAMDSPDVWFATGKMLNASQRDCIDGTYDLVSRAGCAWRVGQGRPDGKEYSELRTIAMASGTATLFRAELFCRVGLYDPIFDSYLEDVDFGIRCAIANLTGVYVPDAIAYHWGSTSLGAWSPRMVRLVSRNQWFLVTKHFAPKLRRRYRWQILTGQGLWGLLALRHGAGWAFLKGKVEGFRRAKSIQRRVGDGEAVSRLLDQNEQEIRQIQHRTGADLYWRVYFLLTAGGND